MPDRYEDDVKEDDEWSNTIHTRRPYCKVTFQYLFTHNPDTETCGWWWVDNESFQKERWLLLEAPTTLWLGETNCRGECIPAGVSFTDPEWFEHWSEMNHIDLFEENITHVIPTMLDAPLSIDLSTKYELMVTYMNSDMSPDYSGDDDCVSFFQKFYYDDFRISQWSTGWNSMSGCYMKTGNYTWLSLP